ncbi:oligoribonuclease [Desulfobulbus oligotrophicus]|jgi:oligoribonuclease|uniref:Oligoribonuclease n=1 Tax=Desulfobulbus oligotrophicus TaxID=1909699 RepID=A0A7T5VCX9_9BACT|nr:oligoribonuclease [Desulfobulbus oligotrophicus]MDY0391359.1 oligoribonuclease [Desulfobulbus oligotrophicus]QQG65605.1 oligoribonuclease [Desulfobulbus oligotrophicus]
MQSDGNLVWIDLEMTGLNPMKDKILEVATVVTNPHLDILADGPVIAIHQPEEVLEAMDAWNRKHHRESGLLERVRQSTVTCRQAELETLDFVKQWVRRRISPMCGNSVWHDRRFLARFMPELERYFHYRNIDVSTLKELAWRWAPNLPRFDKECHHLALDDIRESIAELKHYSNSFIRKEA